MKRFVFLIVLIVALASTTLAVAAARNRVSAHLSIRVEVPRPVGVKKAAGAFSGSYGVNANYLKLKWKLSFAHLSGAATAATLRIGKPGLIGEEGTLLCKPCKSGRVATTLMHKPVATALRAGNTYGT